MQIKQIAFSFTMSSNEISELAEIKNYPADPLDFFERILNRHTSNELTMNLATIDAEFGVLNRTVLYRGISHEDGGIIYVTQQYTRNCQNLKSQPKACITIYMPQLRSVTAAERQEDEEFTNWQIRLIDATAVEIVDEAKLSELWSMEPLYAKIRAIICECGKPVDHTALKAEHARLLEAYKQDSSILRRPNTYTAFKFLPQRWDFYKSTENKIADRVQYRKQADGLDWTALHVAT